MIFTIFYLLVNFLFQDFNLFLEHYLQCFSAALSIAADRRYFPFLQDSLFGLFRIFRPYRFTGVYFLGRSDSNDCERGYSEKYANCLLSCSRQ